MQRWISPRDECVTPARYIRQDEAAESSQEAANDFGAPTRSIRASALTCQRCGSKKKSPTVVAASCPSPLSVRRFRSAMYISRHSASTTKPQSLASRIASAASASSGSSGIGYGPLTSMRTHGPSAIVVSLERWPDCDLSPVRGESDRAVERHQRPHPAVSVRLPTRNGGPWCDRSDDLNRRLERP